MISWQLKLAVKVLKAGGVIAYPTESVFGLGCDASNLTAVARLLAIKKRHYKKGLIVLVSDIQQAYPMINKVSAKQLANIEQNSPRATTWLINKQQHISPLVSGEHAKLAVRVTQHPIAVDLCNALGRAVISTSCNRSTKATSTQASTIRNRHLLEVDFIVGGRCGGQAPSRIIDLESGAVIRE